MFEVVEQVGQLVIPSDMVRVLGRSHAGKGLGWGAPFDYIEA